MLVVAAAAAAALGSLEAIWSGYLCYRKSRRPPRVAIAPREIREETLLGAVVVGLLGVVVVEEPASSFSFGSTCSAADSCCVACKPRQQRLNQTIVIVSRPTVPVWSRQGNKTDGQEFRKG